jgi:hypothetical protein
MPLFGLVLAYEHMPTILSDYRTHDSETQKLLNLCGTLYHLPVMHQKLVVEIVLLRLFSLFENFVASVTLKLVCGATYADGSCPTLLAQSRSSISARILLQDYHRTRPGHQLKWSKACEIKENVRYVIDHTDNLIMTVDRNGSIIDELRRVRNRIAHNNTQSRINYREVVRRHYGAYLNNITPGMLLLTSRKHPVLIEQYIKQERILVKDITKA